jgi:ABC-type antimicrobial peptide transport system permease subunit
LFGVLLVRKFNFCEHGAFSRWGLSHGYSSIVRCGRVIICKPLAVGRAVLERTRETGILKSMGASKWAIVGLVLRETAAIAIVGVVLGIAGTFGVKVMMAHFFSTTNFEITGLWMANASGIAFAGAMCGALCPAWLPARKDPIGALAYE